MDKEIIWSSQHFEFDTKRGGIKEVLQHAIDSSEDGETAEVDLEELSINNILSTPFGLWNVDDTMNPFRQFKLWMGHTNFSIGENTFNILDKTPGVEVLWVMTRYRFIIGVGEAFDIRDVRLEIENRLCGKHQDDIKIKKIKDAAVRTKVQKLKQDLDSQYTKWGIYVFPNGKIDNVTIDDQDFHERIELYKEAETKSNGVIITNEAY
jgi:hypothetical protein